MAISKADFKIGDIRLTENEIMGYTFKFPTCSASTVNDGAVPYGRTIASVSVTVYSSDGTDVTSAIIDGTPTLNGELVTVVFTYPTDYGVGKYKAIFELTLDNSWVSNEIFATIYAETLI